MQEIRICNEGLQTNANTELEFVGCSDSLQTVNQLIQQVAKVNVNVLILGESGTGKELVAKNIHYYSKRANEPFIAINCGAIPNELFESELFGHEKGAFTGAISKRIGRYEMANKGSLFLDEIGDMPLNTQVKLLRVIQEKVFQRVGSNKDTPADVRIISATHANLEKKVLDGDFREDLFYRLNVVPICIPPLRERAEDIPLLIKHANKKLEKIGLTKVCFTDNSINCLINYDWPGNVRELYNLVQRMSALYPGELINSQKLPVRYRSQNFVDDEQQLNHSPKLKKQLNNYNATNYEINAEQICSAKELNKQIFSSISNKFDSKIFTDNFDLKLYLSEIEQKVISEALTTVGGVVAHAAKKLGIQRTTLVEKIKKYKL